MSAQELRKVATEVRSNSFNGSHKFLDHLADWFEEEAERLDSYDRSGGTGQFREVRFGTPLAAARAWLNGVGE